MLRLLIAVSLSWADEPSPFPPPQQKEHHQAPTSVTSMAGDADPILHFLGLQVGGERSAMLTLSWSIRRRSTMPDRGDSQKVS